MPRKTTIYLYDGDDFERLSELRRKVEIAERRAEQAARAPRRFGDSPADDGVQQAKDAYDAAVDEAAERAESWVLQAIGHEEFRELLKAHPARKVTEGEGDEAREVTHPEDAGFDVNTESFGKALLRFADDDDTDHRTILEPALTGKALEKRLRRLAAGEFDTLWIAAYQLNLGGVADPKLDRFSTTPTSSAT